MKKIGFALSVLMVAVMIQSCAQQNESDQVCIKDNCVNVEIVRNEEDRRWGLMERDSLEADAGMLFIFDQSGVYPFWMKDTLIPLDIIWMDYARNVVYIAEDVPPCEEDPCLSYNPDKEALYVLEVNAGYAAEKGLQLGDTAQFQLRTMENKK